MSYTNPTSSASATSAAAANAGYDPADLSLGADGHIYGVQRVLDSTSSTPGTTRYTYKTVDLGPANNLAAVSAASLIPVAQLQALMPKLQADYNNYNLNQSVTVDPNGQIWVKGGNGQRVPATAADIDAGKYPGVTIGDLARAQADAGQTKQTTTQMGQFTVAGMNPDGSLEVRDYYGTLSTVSAADAAAGKIPGVSYAQFQQAQADFANNQRTLNTAGQYSVIGTDQYGNLQVRDGRGNLSTVTPQQAAGLPGISGSDIQQAQYTAQNLAWQLQPVQSGQSPFSAQQAIPTAPPGTNPLSLPTTNPPRGAPPTTGTTPGTPPASGTGTGTAPGTTNPNDSANPTGPTPTLVPGTGAGWGDNPIGNNPAGTYATTTSAPAAAATPQFGNGYGTSPTAYGQTPATAFHGTATTGGSAAPATTQYSQTSANPNGTSSASAAPSLSAGQQASYSAYSSTPSTAGGRGPTPAYSTTPSAPAANAPTLGTSGNPAGGMTHQQQYEQNQGYSQNQSMIEAQNAGQSRDMSGMGFSGIQAPRVAGY